MSALSPRETVSESDQQSVGPASSVAAGAVSVYTNHSVTIVKIG